MNRKINLALSAPFPLGADDIVRGMEEIGSYLDITLEDFRAVYEHAYASARRRLLSSVTATAIMRSPVLCVYEDDGVAETIAFLDAHGISGAPVLNAAGRLVGIVSERDVLRLLGEGEAVTAMHVMNRLLRRELPFPASLGGRVGDIMTREVLTAAPQTPLGELARLLRENGINRLPVTDGEGDVAGIVSRMDIINAFGEM